MVIAILDNLFHTPLEVILVSLFYRRNWLSVIKCLGQEHTDSKKQKQDLNSSQLGSRAHLLPSLSHPQ